MNKKEAGTAGGRGRRLLFLVVPLLIGAAAVVAAMTGTVGKRVAATAAKRDIVSWFVADIDRDSMDELLVIMNGDGEGETRLDTGERYGSYVRVYSDYEMMNEEPVPGSEADYEFDLSEIKPLKVMAGDINGDGEMELAVCVYKTTKFHPVLAKRPFFYGINEGELESVWLGSRLARPFADYVLSDVDYDGIDEIVSIEFMEDGGQVLAVYDWKGFGFEVKAVTEKLEGNASFLNNIHEKCDEILVEIGGLNYRLTFADSAIELKKSEGEK